LPPSPYFLEYALFTFFDTEAWYKSVLFSAESLSSVFTESTRDISLEELYDRRLHYDRLILMKFGHARVLFIKGDKSSFEMQLAFLSGPVLLRHQLRCECDFDSAVSAELATPSTAYPTNLKQFVGYAIEGDAFPAVDIVHHLRNSLLSNAEAWERDLRVVGDCVMNRCIVLHY
jgi:hypothetical protein